MQSSTCYIFLFFVIEKRNDLESYLHHILPPLSIVIVVGSIVQILVLLLQVDAALAASLSDLAVCPNHVDETKDGEHDWD